MTLPRHSARSILVSLISVFALCGNGDCGEGADTTDPADGVLVVNVLIDGQAHTLSRTAPIQIQIEEARLSEVSFEAVIDGERVDADVQLDGQSIFGATQIDAAPGMVIDARVEAEGQVVRGSLEFIAELKPATLVITTEGDGDVLFSGGAFTLGVAIEVPAREAFSLSVAAGSESRFASWSGDCVNHLSGGMATTPSIDFSLEPDAYVNCHASFGLLRDVVVGVASIDSSTDFGKVVLDLPSGLIDCHDMCQTAVDSDTRLRLIPQPMSGFVFSGWTQPDCLAFADDDGAAVTRDVECVANFEPAQCGDIDFSTVFSFNTTGNYYEFSAFGDFAFTVGRRPSDGPESLRYSLEPRNSPPSWVDVEVPDGRPADLRFAVDINPGDYDLMIEGYHDSCGMFASPAPFSLGPYHFKAY